MTHTHSDTEHCHNHLAAAAAEIFKHNHIALFLGEAIIRHHDNSVSVHFRIDENTLQTTGITLSTSNSPTHRPYRFRRADVGVQTNSMPTNIYVGGYIREQVDQANLLALQAGSLVIVVKPQLSQTDVDTGFQGIPKYLDAEIVFD